MNKILSKLLRPRTEVLWHPESPGMKVKVTRTWIGRFFKPDDFATLSETIKYHKGRDNG